MTSRLCKIALRMMLALLIYSAASVSSAQNRIARSCGELFSDSRLDTIIAHQNELRRSKGIAETALGGKVVEQDEGGRHVYLIEMPESFSDETTLGRFIVYENSLIRAEPNDIFSLNFVYTFEQEKLTSLQSYARWLLSRQPDDQISLYRKMSPAEFTLWQEKSYPALGRDWGYGHDVLHFSTDRQLTTVPGPVTFPVIEIQIAREKLLELERQGRLWAAILDSDSMVSEIVIPAEQIPVWIESRSIRILSKAQ